MTSVSASGTKKKKEPDLKQNSIEEQQLTKEELVEVQKQPMQQAVVHSVPYPFMPLYSHYSLRQRLKSTLPFSKLFFSSPCSTSSIQDTLIKSITTNNHTENHSSNNKTHSTAKQLSHYPIIHDQKRCMFLMELDSKGRTAALCYLPTRVKNVIEAYHTEIPIQYRHQGVGDKLVKKCLDWAKESGTSVIPNCQFVKRHLDCVGHHKYDSVIVKNEQETSKFPLGFSNDNQFSL